MRELREIRRKDRAISEEEAMEILEKGEYGFLATVDKNSTPHIVPLSYIIIGDCLYFHTAKEGQKVDNIRHERRVCFSVVGDTQPIYDKNFTTYYESVVVYGRAKKVDNNVLKDRVLTKLCEKYLPEHMDKAEEAIKGSFDRTGVCEISIDHITGKAKRAG